MPRQQGSRGKNMPTRLAEKIMLPKQRSERDNTIDKTDQMEKTP